MKKSFVVLASVSAAAFALLTFVPTGAAASWRTTEAAVSWSVRPADADGADGRSWAELEVHAGETITDYAAVHNLGSADAEFALSAADGYFTETGRFNMLPSGEASADAGSWIVVADSVIVPAGAVVVVPYSVTVPVDATPGDHAAGLAASLLDIGKAEDGTAIGVESRVGFRVVVRVEGRLAPNLSMVDVETSVTPSWNPFAPSTVEIEFSALNDGNTQLSFTQQVSGEQAVPRGDLLPGESRRSLVRTTAWPLFLVPVEVSLTPETLDGSGDAPRVTQTYSVWVIPWSQGLVLVGAAMIASAAVKVRRASKLRLERMLDQARAEARRETLSSSTFLRDHE